MNPLILKESYHELGWDVLKDFRSERELINKEHYEQVLMSFQKSISPTSMGKPTTTQVKNLVIGLLGKLNTAIFRNEKSTILSNTEKVW